MNKTIARVCYPIDVDIEMIDTYLNGFDGEKVNFNTLNKEEQQDLLLEVAEHYFEVATIEPYVLERYDEYHIEITQDEDAPSPDDWRDNNLFIVTTNNRNFEVLRKGFDVLNIQEYLTLKEKYKNVQSVEEFDDTSQECAEYGDLINLRYDYGFEEYHIFPLNAYIHSGVALSISRAYPFNCQFDSGQIGYVLVSKEECENRDTAEKLAKGLVEDWNIYLSGDVWNVAIKDSRGEYVEFVGGFYGYSEAEKEAQILLEGCKKIG